MANIKMILLSMNTDSLVSSSSVDVLALKGSVPTVLKDFN